MKREPYSVRELSVRTLSDFETLAINQGRCVAKFALRAAVDSIGKEGGGVVEAYPVASPEMAAVPEWRWFGTPGMFRKEGFRTVAPLGTSGVLMRKMIAPRRAKKP